jgi:hypothetical protein
MKINYLLVLLLLMMACHNSPPSLDQENSQKETADKGLKQETVLPRRCIVFSNPQNNKNYKRW